MRRDSERQRTEQNYPIVALVPIRQGYIIERIKYMYDTIFQQRAFDFFLLNSGNAQS